MFYLNVNRTWEFCVEGVHLREFLHFEAFLPLLVAVAVVAVVGGGHM